VNAMSEHDTSDMSEKLDNRISAVEVDLNKMRNSTQEEPQWNLGIVHIKRSISLQAEARSLIRRMAEPLARIFPNMM
jgi:hypothetical protein